MIAVVAEFLIHANCVSAWRELITAHAARCVQREPGCLQFDVSVDPDDEQCWTLYEVYADADAVTEHRSTPHFGSFFAAAQRLFSKRSVKQLRRITTAVRSPSGGG
jgi:quinol monooxygenase YgiN